MLQVAALPFVVSTLLAPAAAPAVSVAQSAGPVGANVKLVTSGLAFGDFTYPVAEGKRVTISRHVLDPGEIVTWNSPGTTVAINQTGELRNFPSCTSQQTWRAFPAYYVVRSEQLGTLQGVTANLGQRQVELFTITSEAIGAPQTEGQLHRHSGDEIPGVGDLTGGGEAEESAVPGGVVDPVGPANGCPSGPAAESARLAAGVMGAAQGISLIDHNQIAIYRHTVPAGYNSGWYSPFDPTFVVPVRGEITVANDCADAVTREPGTAFMANPRTLVRSTGGAEYLSVSWNIQNGMSVEQPLYIPELPPTDCPDSPLR